MVGLNRQRGSAMVMAIFVLFVVTAMGVGLLFLGQMESKMALADVSAKKAFYHSEGGLEVGRTMLFRTNLASADPSNLTEELRGLSGGDDVLDFDPSTLQLQFDADDELVGTAGHGNDLPVTGLTTLGDGWYAAFVNNDFVDGLTSPIDTNDRVLVTAVGVGKNRSTEIVQALVQRKDTFAVPPATITILGPNPVFHGGKNSGAKYVGNDYGIHCVAGSGSEAPAVGVVGADAEASAESGIVFPHNFVEGAETGVDAVDDIGAIPSLPDLWTNCSLMLELARTVRDSADVVGDSSTAQADLGTPANPKSVFIEGDYDIDATVDGAGLLWVTGSLDFHTGANWRGMIFAIGKGDFERDGAGNGWIVGAIIVADIAGQDRVLFTADDCAGDDGMHGTGDDGMSSGSFLVTGSNSGTTGYCSEYFTRWQGMRPFEILSFRQF